MYDHLITHERARKSSVPSRTLAEETSSDRSRILYSSPFRRLQNKAQVFSLESNAAVRSRLTHTLEVADVGKIIAQKITKYFMEIKILVPDQAEAFINLVEVACIAHDIGNPPFGHFCEAAIQKWFSTEWEDIYKKSRKENNKKIEAEDIKLLCKLVKDFEHFDGNPQGVRIILSLQEKPDSNDGNGLNLTFSAILSCLKYVALPNEVNSEKPLYKKAGYFYTEEKKIKTAKIALNIKDGQRFPLTYIMEAADDIAYCASDIEDGIEKGIVDSDHFFKNIKNEFDKLNVDKLPFEELDKVEAQKGDAKFLDFKILLTRNLITSASNHYIMNHESILKGNDGELFPDNSVEKLKLKALKNYARRYLFRSPQAEDNEIAGYKIIYGILDNLKLLLECSEEEFQLLIDSRENPGAIQSKGLDIQWRYFNKLPDKYVDIYNSYRNQIKKGEPNFYPCEWFYRAHLLTDYISGMTDSFALETYKLLNGMRIT